MKDIEVRIMKLVLLSRTSVGGCWGWGCWADMLNSREFRDRSNRKVAVPSIESMKAYRTEVA
jgi:hypothetical protein